MRNGSNIVSLVRKRQRNQERPLLRTLGSRLAFCFILSVCSSLTAAEWSIPVAGNAFRSVPAPEGRRNGFQRDGILAWSDAEAVYSVYFHVDRAAALELSLNARATTGRSSLVARAGDTDITFAVEGTEFGLHKIGRIEVARAGYVRVDLRGETRNGTTFAEIRDLQVASSTEGLVVDFVKNNDGNMFYWGRRGPSVHLTYQTSKDAKLEYAYSEITVPKGQDTIGSYFMANGFGEGYFGIQVNGPQERRVLFSVWSPFKTDNPKDIPKEQRIVSLGSGPDVRIGEFGNEGAGGQSYLVYPWKADVTYCFLTQVKPDGPSTTVYTAWFCDKSTQDWRLVASFQRPMTHTFLRGFHSFLENFIPAYGHVERQANYGNVWVRSVDGTWMECAEARFSVDATGGGRHRLDFQGGARDDHFFLRNCGFFDQTSKAGEIFSRQSSEQQMPKIDLDALPRS